MHRLHRRGVAKAVRDQQSPVPVVFGVGLRVRHDQEDRRIDVARLVGDSQVQLEVGPVVRQRVDDLLEARSE